MMGFGFDLIFNLFLIFFLIVFVLVIATFVVGLGKGISRWNRNNHSPRLTVAAQVVSKRSDVSHHHHHHGDGMDHYTTNTTYYATFQVESGDRMELHVPDREYGMLVEGDRGVLSFQGTRYLGFQRQ